MKHIVYLLIFVPLVLAAQQEAGIHFENGLSWSEIKAKAKSENKFIFVDCYATWCGPCKAMDELVYPEKKVGDYYNALFISVKVQLDKTVNDNEQTKKWYSDAANLQSTYAVTAFPTFLFFSPDGKPLHRVVGRLSAEQFISLAKDAQDSTKEYYSVLKNFQPGKFDTAELRGLARSFRHANKDLAGEMLLDYFNRIPSRYWGDSSNLQFLVDLRASKQANQIVIQYLKTLSTEEFSNLKNLQLIEVFNEDSVVKAMIFNYEKDLPKKEFKKKGNLELVAIFKDWGEFKILSNNYINGLANKEIFTKDNILFIRNFIDNSTDKEFQIFYRNSEKINAVLRSEGYAENFIDKVISTEEIKPFTDAAKKDLLEPDWNKIEGNITIKYGEKYANRNIAAEKPAFYRSTKKWNEYAKYLVQYVDNYAPIKPTSAYYLNNMAWEIFENTSDQHDLERANYWMDVALQTDTSESFYYGYMDTKANILYKLLGKKKEAIALEEAAVAMGIRRNDNVSDLAKNLEQMKRGENTWPDKK